MSIANKDTKVSVPGFQVDQNVIYYGNTAINTNNISMISISSIPSNKSWIIAAIIALLGLKRFSAGGWFPFIIAAIWIIGVVIYNRGRGEDLAISLNCGNTLYFHCRERDFLERVVSLVTECIKTGSESYFINFDRCAINRGIARDISVKV